MKKKITILAVILCVITVYSVFWFWQGQRFKQSVAGILDDVATELHQLDMELLYSELRVSGFPFSHQVYIHQPRFIGLASDFPFDLVSHVPMVVEMNLLGTGYSLILPHDIEIQHIANEKTKAYQLLFYSKPELSVGVSYDHNFSRLLNFWTNEEINNEQFYMDGVQLKSLAFKSDAISAMAVDNGVKLLTVKALGFDYEISVDKGLDYQRLQWNIDHLQSEPFLNLAWSSDVPFGVFNSSGDIELWLPMVDSGENTKSDLIVQAHKANVDSEHFHVDLSGDLTVTDGQAVSEKPLVLSLKNYEKAVEYAAAFYNRYLADDESQRRYWTDKARIKRALRKLASQVSDDEASLVLKVEPTEDGEEGAINIGDYSLKEAVKVWETGYGTIRKRVPPKNEPHFRTKKLVPSKEIKKQIEGEGAAAEGEEDDDTVYVYPNSNRRRR